LLIDVATVVLSDGIPGLIRAPLNAVASEKLFRKSADEMPTQPGERKKPLSPQALSRSVFTRHGV